MSFLDTASVTAANALVGDAAAPYALFYGTSRYIGTIVPDVTVREVHTNEFTITSHPVETGTPISDHVFANPKVIEIQCGFSDSSGGYAGYVQDVYQQFLALADTRQVFEVSTGKALYENMLFGNITVVTDEESEFALMVTARLQEVIITSTDGTSGTSLSPATQLFPAETSSQANLGNVTLQPAPGVPSFVTYQNLFPSTAVTGVTDPGSLLTLF